MSANILVIDDDLSFLSSMKSIMRKQGYRTSVASSPGDALKIYSQERMDFDLLLIDYKFKNSDITGADLAEVIKRQNPLQPFIFMSGFDDKDFLKAMLKVGSSRNFIEKGTGPETIVEVVRLALSELGIKNRPEEDTLEDEMKRESEIRTFGIVGRSKALHSIVRQVENYRKFKSRFLILGPTGSGKEAIAKAFQIPGKPFYAIDCTRFMSGQEHFLESELYGHKKGAYTGADQDKRGAFEVANGGVIFLDELHCLSLTAQSKLLRTLQEMKFRRLGDSSGQEMPFDATIVAATKPEILSMMEHGEFKEDLYYRLAKSEIRIPALSERPEDIKPLAQFFAEKYCVKHKLSRVLHPQTIREMEAYSWPGNIRELDGVIDDLIMKSQDEVITPEQFQIYLAKRLSAKSENENKTLEKLDLTVDSIEVDFIIQALKKSRFISNAAEALGIARTTLNDRLKKFKIDPYQYLGTEK